MTRENLMALNNALAAATDNGTLDHLAIFLHPDTINQFCDAVQAAIEAAGE